MKRLGFKMTKQKLLSGAGGMVDCLEGVDGKGNKRAIYFDLTGNPMLELEK